MPSLKRKKQMHNICVIASIVVEYSILSTLQDLEKGGRFACIVKHVKTFV